MAYDPRTDSYRLHNPWEKFTQRDVSHYNAEDRSRLCPPQTPISTAEAINRFLAHGYIKLNQTVPRKHQLLRDFLGEVITAQRGASTTVESGVLATSRAMDVALLDDRQKHDRCAKSIGQNCSACKIFSKNLSIPELYKRLQEERLPHGAEKRIIFIPDLTPAGALVLASTTARRSTIPIRSFLHRYLGKEHLFSVVTTWGFFLEFHIPYHAMRTDPCVKDDRKACGKRIRKSDVLPLRKESQDTEDLYYHEAQISSLSWGPDEWFWTELFLVDTYFGSENNLLTYLAGSQNGNGLDPPLGGVGGMNNPHFDPREYWLVKVDRRMMQVTEEYTALIETFNKRMEAYARSIRRKFEDDNKRTHTQTLSNVIETIQIFVDCISCITDAWDIFCKNQLSFFTVHARDKPKYPERIDSIIRSMAELDRLKRVLIIKRERFKFKLDSLHTVSSLSQTETAIAQGENIKTLTKMTVYVAFPLLFTAAIFSMDFVTLKYPWAFFFVVLVFTTLLNYMIAAKKGPWGVCLDGRDLVVSAWERWDRRRVVEWWRRWIVRRP